MIRKCTMPKVVQEKEAERVSRQLTDSSITTSSTARISEKDRKDFLTTYGAGRREEAFEILERRSFRENMFLGESRENQHTDASKGKEADGNAIADKASVKAAQAEKPKPLSGAVAMRELNLASVDLSGMNAGGSAAELSAAEIPRAADSRSKSR